MLLLRHGCIGLVRGIGLFGLFATVINHPVFRDVDAWSTAHALWPLWNYFFFPPSSGTFPLDFCCVGFLSFFVFANRLTLLPASPLDSAALSSVPSTPPETCVLLQETRDPWSPSSAAGWGVSGTGRVHAFTGSPF